MNPWMGELDWNRKMAECTAAISTQGREFTMSAFLMLPRKSLILFRQIRIKARRFLFWEFPGPRNATTEDCTADDRGNTVIDALDDGFYIFKMIED